MHERILIIDNRRIQKKPLLEQFSRKNPNIREYKGIEEIKSLSRKDFEEVDLIWMAGGDGTFGLVIDRYLKNKQEGDRDPLFFVSRIGGTARTTALYLEKYASGSEKTRALLTSDPVLKCFLPFESYKLVEYYALKVDFGSYRITGQTGTPDQENFAYLFSADNLTVRTQEIFNGNKSFSNKPKMGYALSAVANAVQNLQKKKFSPEPEYWEIQNGDQSIIRENGKNRFAMASAVTHRILGSFVFPGEVSLGKIRSLVMAGSKGDFVSFYSKYLLALVTGIINPSFPVRKGLIEMRDAERILVRPDSRLLSGFNANLDGEMIRLVKNKGGGDEPIRVRRSEIPLKIAVELPPPSLSREDI